MSNSIEGFETPNDRQSMVGAGDYSPEDERRAVRKVDFLVLPLIMLCFIMLQFVSHCSLNS